METQIEIETEMGIKKYKYDRLDERQACYMFLNFHIVSYMFSCCLIRFLDVHVCVELSYVFLMCLIAFPIVFCMFL